MSNNEPRQPPKRQYPPAYERVLPIALIVIGIGVIVILAIIFAVALGLFPTSQRLF